MRRLLATLTLAALPFGAAADSVDTFRQLCVANAGQPNAINAAAKKAGFEVVELSPGSFMGMRAKSDESVQVNVATRHSFECAVTTSSEGNARASSARFFGSLGLTPRGNTAAAKVGGKTYTFLYDPKGGEAFVLYTK